MDMREYHQCARYCRKYWPEDCAHILRIADDAVEKRFIFDLPWDMEPTAKAVEFTADIHWQYMPEGDPEFIYQFNRHRYWICLGQAYAMTGSRRYLECFCRQLRDWLEKNPLTEENKKTTWRSIEAGIRGENWLKAVEYFHAELPEDIRQLFLEGMKLHGEYLWRLHVPFSDKSNWGVLESRGLFCIGAACILYGEDAADRQRGEQYIAEALTRLERELRIQILPDGVQWEQSPMYHNEVLKCVFEVMRMAKSVHIALPQSIVERARRMVYADLAWRKPDGTQPATGDSDPTDIRDVLTAGAWIFQDPVLKAAGYPVLDFESVWEYGIEAAKAYERMEAAPPEKRAYALADSGHYILRSGWGEDADYAHFSCGSMGGGHGHFDRLHLDLTLGGEDILVDPGRYTYVDGDLRRYLKSTAAHNVPIVDGQDDARCVDSWKTESQGSFFGDTLRQCGEFTLLQGAHTGYQALGVVVERQIVTIGTGLYVVCDRFMGDGKHRVSQQYHFPPEGKVKLTKNGFRYDGQRRAAVFQVLSDAGVELAQQPYSRRYNQLEQADCVRVSTDVTLPATLITVIGDAGAADAPEHVYAELLPAVCPVTGETLPAAQAQCVRIRKGMASWLVLLNHQDNGADREYIGAEGYYGLGRVMAVRENGTDRIPETLLW